MTKNDHQTRLSFCPASTSPTTTFRCKFSYSLLTNKNALSFNKNALSFNKNALSFNKNLLGKIWHWSDDGDNSANKGSLLFCATKDFFNWCQSINHNEQKPIYKNISNENRSPFNQILSIFWKYLRSSFQSNAYILRPISPRFPRIFLNAGHSWGGWRVPWGWMSEGLSNISIYWWLTFLAAF